MTRLGAQTVSYPTQKSDSDDDHPAETWRVNDGTVFELNVLFVRISTQSVPVVLVAVLFAGCAADHVEDERDECALQGPLPEHCYATSASVDVHWSFETLSGDSKASCLPGSPDVTISLNRLMGGVTERASVPCAGGTAQMSIRTDGLFGIIVTSLSDHLYRGTIDLSGMQISSGAVLPTVVIYTDAGNVHIDVHIKDASGTDTTCEATSIKKLRVLLDGAVVREDDCSTFENGNHLYYANLFPVSVGVHTASVEGLNSTSSVIATSAPADVTVLAASSVTADLVLTVTSVAPPP